MKVEVFAGRVQLLINLLLSSVVARGHSQRQEENVVVCQTEHFEASCERKDEVILMTSAAYGRMEVSRCVQSDYGYIGCSADVLDVLDPACSGRRRCSIGVPSAALERAAAVACPGDLKLYLTASYRCLPVVVGDSRPCLPSTSFALTSRRGYISSAVSDRTMRGTTQCPWIVEARQGQRVNVTLWDFASASGVAGGGDRSTAAEMTGEMVQPCQAYAVIRERSPARSLTVCNQTKRNRLVYTSTSETVEIRVLPGGHGKETRPKHFLLHYELYGCPDAEAMDEPGYWFERHGNQLEVGCTGANDRWWLKCDGFEWIGEWHRNCSIAGLMYGEAKEKDVLPWATSLAAVVAIAVLLSAVIVTGGLFVLGCHRRSRNRSIAGNKPSDTYYRSPLKNDHCIGEHRPEIVGQSQYNTGNGRFVEHEYSYIADLQPPTISTSGPCLGPTGCRVAEEVDGEFDVSGRGLIGSGQPRLCRPVIDCGAQPCAKVLLPRSALQLVDQPQQTATPAFSSVVSLADDDTIAVRGVAPLPRGNVAPSPAAKPNIDPRAYTRNFSFPPVSGYCDSLENAASSQ